MPDATSPVLHGYGRLPWPAALPLLADCACTWTDFDGIHLTTTPPLAVPPAATHLWGWSPTRLVRLRFDTDTVYAALLGTPPAGAPAPLLTETVTPRVRPLLLTAADDKRSGPLPAPIQGTTWQLTEVTGESPTTFVRALP